MRAEIRLRRTRRLLHCANASKTLRNSAKIVDEPSMHDYGEDYWADKSYGAVDPEGHFWWFTQRIRDPRT